MLISENSKNIKIPLNSWRFFGYLKIKLSPAMMIQEIPRKIRFGSILMHLLFWVLSLGTLCRADLSYTAFQVTGHGFPDGH